MGVSLALLGIDIVLVGAGYRLFAPEHLFAEVEHFASMGVIILSMVVIAFYRARRNKETSLSILLLFLLPQVSISIVKYVIEESSRNSRRGFWSLLLLIIGAFLYASKIPERWLKGRFDFVGHSHMSWHICYFSGLYLMITDIYIQSFGSPHVLWDTGPSAVSSNPS
jgi:predicted membrane channel-forming protein YqfA (hemolysin III family)